MASRSLDFIVNVQGGTLVSSFTSTVQGQLPSFIFGDETPVSVRLVEPSGVSARPWREIDLTDQTVRIGIGVPGSSPTAGTFTLTYGANTTSALAYNASAAQVAAALNALASIVSAGGVTVTASGATYKVVFDDVGVRTALTANVASISPTSGAYISTVLEGSVSAQAIYLFRLEAMPAAYVELADPLPSASVVVATVRAGATGVSEIQTVALSPVPYDGTYTLTVGANETTSLAWNADAATIQAALVALASVGAGNAVVSGEFPAFTITFAASLGNIAATTGNASALIVPTGRSGVLSNNTTGVAELLASRSRVDATLEVEIVDDISGDTWTPLQVSCTLREDVIPNSPSSQTGGPVYLLESVADARYVAIDDLIGDSAPVNSVAASVTITPTGANNDIVVTAVEAGAAGNDLTIALAINSTTTRTQLTAVKTGNAVVVTSGDKRRMIATGTLNDGTNPVVFPELIYDGLYLGKPSYRNGGYSVTWDGVYWNLTSPTAHWYTGEEVETPDLAIDFLPFDVATGIPTVTAAIATAGQINALINANTSLLITAANAAANDGTGVIAAVTATALTGGVTQTATPPYLRTAGGFLYIEEGPVWKKVALSTL